jgi:hypothetical protein
MRVTRLRTGGRERHRSFPSRTSVLAAAEDSGRSCASHRTCHFVHSINQDLFSFNSLNSLELICSYWSSGNELVKLFLEQLSVGRFYWNLCVIELFTSLLDNPDSIKFKWYFTSFLFHKVFLKTNNTSRICSNSHVSSRIKQDWAFSVINLEIIEAENEEFDFHFTHFSYIF